ncbi:hypothetical protein QUA20_02200 [Microcoleus sp. Pol7_A1]|uniref:hypothetical protein n=1 Tax=Microcoleus sp. Pol7_A1 TaxID=2818893 RepID=UPI002FD0F66D
MAHTPLEPIDLLDTDYADILANSSDPLFELQLVRFEVNAASARTTSNFLTLVRQKPETPEQWATLTQAWEVACEYKPTVEDFRLLPELLWETQDSVEVDWLLIILN